MFDVLIPRGLSLRNCHDFLINVRIQGLYEILYIGAIVAPNKGTAPQALTHWTRLPLVSTSTPPYNSNFEAIVDLLRMKKHNGMITCCYLN